MAVTVGEITDLIDDQKNRSGIVLDSSPQCVVTILRCQIIEHVCRRGKQHGMALEIKGSESSARVKVGFGWEIKGSESSARVKVGFGWVEGKIPVFFSYIAWMRPGF